MWNRLLAVAVVAVAVLAGTDALAVGKWTRDWANLGTGEVQVARMTAVFCRPDAEGCGAIDTAQCHGVTVLHDGHATSASAGSATTMPQWCPSVAEARDSTCRNLAEVALSDAGDSGGTWDGIPAVRTTQPVAKTGAEIPVNILVCF